MAVQKLLRSSERGKVQFLGAFDQAKAPTEFVVERFGVVPLDIKAATFLGTFRAEGADNDVTSGLHRPRDVANVCEPFLRFCQKVKNRTVVPHIVRMSRKVLLGHISAEPFD